MLKWIADIMSLLVLGVISYIICMAVDRRPMAQLVMLVSVMLLVLTTIQDLTPTVNNVKARANAFEQKVDRLTAPVEKAEEINDWKEELEQNPIVKFGAREEFYK